GHRPQPHQASACAAHVADVALVSGGGGGDTELASAVNDDVGPGDGRPADAGDIGCGLRTIDADANGVGFIGSSCAADFDIVAAGHNVAPSARSEANVGSARGVV